MTKSSKSTSQEGDDIRVSTKKKRGSILGLFQRKSKGTVKEDTPVELKQNAVTRKGRNAEDVGETKNTTQKQRTEPRQPSRRHSTSTASKANASKGTASASNASTRRGSTSSVPSNSSTYFGPTDRFKEKVNPLAGRNPQDFGETDPYGNPLNNFRSTGSSTTGVYTDPYGNAIPTDSGRAYFGPTDRFKPHLDPLAGRNPIDFDRTDAYCQDCEHHYNSNALDGRNPVDFDPLQLKKKEEGDYENPLAGRNPIDFDWAPRDECWKCPYCQARMEAERRVELERERKAREEAEVEAEACMKCQELAEREAESERLSEQARIAEEEYANAAAAYSAQSEGQAGEETFPEEGDEDEEQEEEEEGCEEFGNDDNYESDDYDEVVEDDDDNDDDDFDEREEEAQLADNQQILKEEQKAARQLELELEELRQEKIAQSSRRSSLQAASLHYLRQQQQETERLEKQREATARQKRQAEEDSRRKEIAKEEKDAHYTSIETKRSICTWYAKLGCPNREEMIKVVEKMDKSCNITREDVESLPWVCGGRLISPKEMNEIIMSQ